MFFSVGEKTEFHPASFPTNHRPNITVNSLLPRNSCLLPNHLWSYLNWVGSISTSLMAKNHPMWMDNGHPKNTKNGKFPNVEMAQNSHVCEGKKQFKDHKRPTKNPGSKSSRLSTKIVFPILGDFFSKFCRHRNYLLSRLGECSPILWLKSGHHQGSEAGPESWP